VLVSNSDSGRNFTRAHTRKNILLNAKKGSWHLKLETARRFWGLNARYRFLRMPFGISSGFLFPNFSKVAYELPLQQSVYGEKRSFDNMCPQKRSL
jgi:hypothetical protein